MLSPILASTRTQAESVLFLEHRMRLVEDKLNEQAATMNKQAEEMNYYKKQMKEGQQRPYQNAPKPNQPASTQQWPPLAQETATPKGPHTLQTECQPGPPNAGITRENASADLYEAPWELQQNQRRPLRQVSGGTTQSSMNGNRARKRSTKKGQSICP